MTVKEFGKKAFSLFFQPVSAIKESENIHDIREEMAAEEKLEKKQEKKLSGKMKKLLIGIAVFLVLAIPTLVKLFWTLSGYFANKLPG